MAFGLMTEAEHNRQMKVLRDELKSALRDAEVYKASRTRLIYQVMQLEDSLKRAKQEAKTAAAKKGCGSDEAEQTFDKNFRIEAAKSVMKLTLAPEFVLDFGRRLFILGYKTARK